SQTSTLQSINFLNVGVILNVTPRISHDDQILMRIKPEVSDGSVDQTSGLPSSNTTTVETDVLLPNGRGIVIGGLIQESDTQNISKIPGLGDIWLLGRLFQRRNIVKERAEVVIFLVPRIVPYEAEFQCLTEGEMARAQMPLLGDQFVRQRRPGEPQLYDTVENPLYLRPRNQAQTGAPPNRPFLRRVTSVFSTQPKPGEKTPAEPAPAGSEGPQLARNPGPPVRPAPPPTRTPPTQTPPPAGPTAKTAGWLPPLRMMQKPATAPPLNAAPPQIPKAGDPAPGNIDFPPPPPKSNTRWADSLKNGTIRR
ncbi:MAG TPA: type II and III secretion system protein, partial [Pirellulales bacterium]|nr:type II and III secretion system protein [Pirellulales bacterium]